MAYLNKFKIFGLISFACFSMAIILIIVKNPDFFTTALVILKKVIGHPGFYFGIGCLVISIGCVALFVKGRRDNL